MSKPKGVSDNLWKRANAVYTESEDVAEKESQADRSRDALKNWKSDGDADAALERYRNYGKFRYDPEEDALYQNARDSAIRAGRIAMEDTAGKAAAMTGGYGNSYAATAGSGAYHEYLAGLNDDLATYYQLALDRYQKGKDDLLTEYTLESERDETDYSRLYDQVIADQEAADSARDFDYGVFTDDVSGARKLAADQNADAWKEAEFDEDKRRWRTELDEEVRQYNADLAESRRQFDETQKLKRESVS